MKFTSEDFNVGLQWGRVREFNKDGKTPQVQLLSLTFSALHNHNENNVYVSINAHFFG